MTLLAEEQFKYDSMIFKALFKYNYSTIQLSFKHISSTNKVLLKYHLSTVWTPFMPSLFQDCHLDHRWDCVERRWVLMVPHANAPLTSGPFHSVFIYQNSNELEKSYPNPSGVIPTNFCTCHDSIAVVTCAKICSTLVTRNWINRMNLQLNLNFVWNVLRRMPLRFIA